MEKDDTYKKLYLDLKKQFDRFRKHRRHHPKMCKDCRYWYKGLLEETKKIKDKQLRDNLTNLWKTLWLNDCKDFDIIASEFNVKKNEKENIKTSN